MKNPISIEIDTELQPPPVYVRYSRELRVTGYSVDPAGVVNVDLDVAGEVIGIELVEADGYTMRLAHEVARRHNLSLPETAADLLCA